MSGMMFYDSRPQHTHTSHASFVQAAMGDCFICRELFSELQSSALSGSRPQIANVSFKMQFLATEEFGCRLIFTVQLARTSTQDPAELTQKFMLGKNTSTIWLDRVRGLVFFRLACLGTLSRKSYCMPTRGIAEE
ncbi:hypothetical protein CRV24_004131 [Beauveria bassiana]|nr:hypothetical protein CRV24_004131 [Beauveria bassiana]KAH8710739.1 hypothetical protein HC256_007570 [Beauveria bassiana]